METPRLGVGGGGDRQVRLDKMEGAVAGLVPPRLNKPVQNGNQFLTQLRQREGGDKPKVVFCTTENDVAHIREAISAGADEYVMKPFDHETLQIKLQLVGMV